MRFHNVDVADTMQGAGEVRGNWGGLCARTGRIVDVRRWRVYVAYVAPIAQW